MTIKLAGIELDYNRVEKRYYDGERYIISYRTVYEITRNNGTFHAKKIYYHAKDNGSRYVPLITKGNFCFGNAAYVNRLAGVDIAK